MTSSSCAVVSVAMPEEEAVVPLENGQVFVLSSSSQDEGEVFEAIQTSRKHSDHERKSEIVRNYYRYNSYKDRSRGPNFANRAEAFVRLFEEHTSVACGDEKKEMDDELSQLLLDSLVQQFSECWNHTQTDLLAAEEQKQEDVIDYSQLPPGQIQFGILVNRKRLAVLCHNLRLDEDHSEDRRLELLRVVHGYFYRFKNRTGLETPALVEHALATAVALPHNHQVVDLVLHILLLKSDSWFPCDLKLKAIAFAVFVLAGNQTTVWTSVRISMNLRRNACHLLHRASAFEGATRRAFEELDVVTTLCQLIRNLEKGTVFYKEATTTLKAILVLPE